MRADTARRYRLYPDTGQAGRLTPWGHTCRTVWNMALEQRRFAWQQRRHTMQAVAQCTYLAQARADLPWLADLPAQCAQQVLHYLDRAYDNWWNRAHPAGAPERKKRTTGLSVPFPGQAVRVRKLNRHCPVNTSRYDEIVSMDTPALHAGLERGDLSSKDRWLAEDEIGERELAHESQEG
jgi:putative transposase